MTAPSYHVNATALTETNAPLATSGTLAVSDLDVSNTVSASVLSLTVGGSGTAGRPVLLTDAMLKDMLSVDTGNVIDATHTSGMIHWNFDSASQAFDFLAAGETLQLTYVVRATDSDVTHAVSDATVTITITGTNDAPTVAAALIGSVNEGDAVSHYNLLAGATDVDDGETLTLSVANLKYAVGTGAPSTTLPAGVTLSADNHTLTVDPTNPAYDHLSVNEQTVITVSYDVKDAQGATVAQTETITIHGTNDAPTVTAVNTDPIVDTSANDSFDPVDGHAGRQRSRRRRDLRVGICGDRSGRKCGEHCDRPHLRDADGRP